MDKIIEVENLKKYYKDVKAVDDISFFVERGELFGFLGSNGAGKSTTINILCTLFPETGGGVSVCGYKLGRENMDIRKKIGVVYQNNCLDNRLSVKENLMISAIYISIFWKDATNLDVNILWQILTTGFLTSLGHLIYPQKELSVKKHLFLLTIYYLYVNIVVLVSGFYYDWFHIDQWKMVVGMVILIAVIYAMITAFKVLRFIPVVNKMNQILKERNKEE